MSLALAAATAAIVFHADTVPVAGVVRRPARLFVAGEYPDKGVTITADHLRQVARRFDALRFDAGADGAVEVITEHRRGIHDPLGHVVAVEVREPDGGAAAELWGMLAFSAETDAHLQARRIERLSVALLEVPDSDGGGYRLKEVSVTESPRVGAARLFTDDEVSARLARFRAEGRVTPAIEERLRPLLQVRTPITFDDGGEPVNVAAAALELVAALPVVQPRGGIAGALATEFHRGGAAAESSPLVRGLASAFGVEPGKVAEQMKGGR